MVPMSDAPRECRLIGSRTTHVRLEVPQVRPDIPSSHARALLHAHRAPERTSIGVSEAFRAIVDLLSVSGLYVRVPLKTMIVFSTSATFGAYIHLARL